MTVLRSGGQVLVDNLVIQGVRSVSCVPGESFLPVLDALRDASDDIQLVVCRHEAAAGNMAEAYGKLTGRAGVCAVTRGPGATHAAIAVHTANQDATPMILLVGQIASTDRGRGAFQELSCAQVFGSMTKWVASLDHVSRIPETIARAFRIAEGGRPGPVVIEMPEDVLFQLSEALDSQPNAVMVPAPHAGASQQIATLLDAAARPLVLVGRGPWCQESADALDAFARRNDLPVVAGFRCEDYIDNYSPQYVGHLGLSADSELRQLVEDADLILAIGGHFGDAETNGYSELKRSEDRKIAHVSIDPIDVDRFAQADLVVQSSAGEFFQAVADLTVLSDRWAHWRASARSAEDERSTPDSNDLLSGIMAHLRSVLPADAVLANGAGNYTVWLHRFAKYRRYGTQLAPASGAMGYGLPAGIAAKALDPDRTVVVFAGDGCFMMSSQELATVKDLGLAVIVIVVNNNMYGTIRLHQEKKYPARINGTLLTNPDFSAYAESFGISGRKVRTVSEFVSAFAAAAGSGEPALIEVLTDPELALPDKTFGQVRQASAQQQ